MKFKSFISVITVCSALLTACATPNTAKDNDKLSVYTSFYAMYDFAVLIGGDKADVHNLCPTGQEPHDYEPTAQDIAALTDADVFIYNGMGMEHWTESVLATLDTATLTVVEASSDVSEKPANGDPHLWLNPQNAYEQMSAIADAFMQADSKNSDYYAERLAECKEKTDELIQSYTTAVQGFTSKDIVVSHDAYSNMCNAFGLNQIAINGFDNAEDTTPARLGEIQRYIEESGIKYIFSEPLGSNSIVETTAADMGCQILVLDPFEGSTATQSQPKDYFTVMYENLEALKTALS